MKTTGLIITAILVMLTSCMKEKKNDSKMTFPKTKKIEHVDTYFGKDIKDPYRWLEDDRSKETEEWVKMENIHTQEYLSQISYRETLKKRMTELFDYETLSTPRKRGDYLYYYKNDGLQNHDVLYRKKIDSEAEEIFLNPNNFSKDGTTSLAGTSFSEDKKTMAYMISEAGSDWKKAIVMNVSTKEQIGDTLVNLKFSGISWYKNEGFFYSSYDKPKGSELSEKTDQHKIYYHKLHTNQEDDIVIFGDDIKRRYAWGAVSKDMKYLIISAANTTSNNEIYYIDLENKSWKYKSLIEGFSHNYSTIYSNNNDFYFVTNYNAPNNQLIQINLNSPSKENWKTIIPETENVLSVSFGANSLFAQYTKDAISLVEQFDLKGKKVRQINLPGLGSVGGFTGEKDDEILYYGFTNYYTPATSYSFNPNDGESKIYFQPKLSFNPSDYISEQVFYTSKDGTRVPMIITHKKGVTKDKKNPTILYGYGGFNIKITPSFSSANLAWMEKGGVLAVANIRGGGEYGKKWHDGGRKMNKQNVFDDFIAAGEYLIRNDYTSSNYLAIRGGSNGGLLVGAVMTQRPDLMKVALPAVGVLDMLRYHTFTAGAGWAYDYGTSEESKEMFEYLLNYSPVHNVKEGVKYPATMVTTGDHDDRVVPAHSFKFAAELQEKQAGNNPILIRINVDAGHGAGKPISMIIDEYVDMYSFTLYNMGITELE